MAKKLVCECGRCARCESRERQRQYRADPVAAERLRENDRRRYYRNREKRLAAMADYQATNPEAKKAANERWRKNNPEKRRAHSAVAYAIRIGKLTKGPCEKAGEDDCYGRVHAHHDDYSKPLEVRWLCARHHKEEHH